MTPEINGYTIQREIGKGGMGMVYKAVRNSDGAGVAIKVLPSHLVNPTSARRFQREGRSLMSIDHQNIVKVYDVGASGGLNYIIMEFVDGRPLSSVLREHKGKISVGQAMDLSRQVAASLEVIHGRRMIHRDLKPANVMVTKDGVVKLLDFGLVQVDGLTMLTATGNVVGTPAYMSPEQCSGTPLDHRSDIYSLGALMYELFTGVPPFSSESLYDLLEMQKKAEAPLPSSIRKDVPQAAEQIILQCLEKAPDQRPMTVTQVIETLGGDATPIERLVPNVDAALPIRHRRGRKLTFVALVLLITGAVMGYRHPQGEALVSNIRDYLADLIPSSSTEGDLSDEVEAVYSQMAAGQDEYLRGKQFQREGNFAVAFDCYAAAVRANPNRHAFYVALITVAGAAERETEAAKLVQHYLANSSAEDPGKLLYTWLQGRNASE